MAFSKVKNTAKKVRSGTTTSVNMANANPEYYKELPVLQMEALNSQTSIQAHQNKFMEIDRQFIQNVGHGHGPGYLATDFKMFGRPALLYRELTQNLVDQLQKNVQDGAAAPKRATVLNGKLGAGKSAELLKLASVAASAGYITIYAPSTLHWVNSSRPYAPDHNETNRMFVQHEITSELLQSAMAISKDALVKVPLGKTVTVGKRSLDGQKTLADLVDLGLQIPALANDVLDQFVAIAASQSKVPVFIGLDDVNTLWCQTTYRDQEDVVLPANRLRLISTFLPYFEGKSSLAKGWVVGAASYNEVRFMTKELNKRLNPSPAYKLANPELAKDSNVVLSSTDVPFDIIQVDRMTPDEASALLKFYQQTSIVSIPVTNALVAKYWVLANGNPRQMFANITSYF